MSRYAPVDALMLAIHQVLAAHATRERPLTRGQINAQRQESGALVGQALDRLLDAGLLSTLRVTRDGATTDIYWPTGLKPIVPPTSEELSKMAETKASRIERIIELHGPLSRDDLAAQCREAGLASVTPKNVRSMIAAAIDRGRVVLGKGKDGTNLFMTAAQSAVRVADSPVAASASLPDDAAELSRYRELLDQLASSLHCDTYESLLNAVSSLGTTPPPHGRLAILHTHDMVGGVLEYLEPHLGEEDAREHVLTRVNRGDLDHCMLVRCLFQARRQITYGPIEAPEIETLGG